MAASSVEAPTTAFPANVRFEHCNFVQEPPGAMQLGVDGVGVGQFDVVSCFSTSKWIHLNFGDAGLKRLFARAHACLRKGVERHGGALLNATAGGSLDELERVDFDGLF